MKTTHTIVVLAGSALLASMQTTSAWAQRGAGVRGGGGVGAGARSAGFRAPGAAPNVNAGPSMSRPGGGGQVVQRPAGVPGGIQRPNAGQPGAIQRPNADGAGGVQRPNVGHPGGIQRPNAGGAGGLQRPNGGGSGGTQRPNAGGQGAPSSAALHDFLGTNTPNAGAANRLPEGIQRLGAGQPGGIQRPGPRVLGAVNQPPAAGGGARINAGDRTNIGADARNTVAVGGNTTNVNVGNVNVGNRVNYSDNRQAWVSQRQNWGNNVRTGVAGRYNNVFNESFYRGGFVRGGYNYYGGWVGRGPYYAWSPVTWAAMGTFFGAAWVNAHPTYYAYGQGGNVYYENNVVYVNGQAEGSPEQYYQQAQALAAAAPPTDQINGQQQEWLPLGVFALTSEDTGDSQAVVQLAVNKQGVIAGTYYNEANQVNRPIQGTVDLNTQRAAMGFADKKNADLVLETSVNNLTQDEAPALLHYGAEQSQPMLLVRLKQPAGQAPSQ